MSSLYDVLGLEKGASVEEIRKAYKEQAKLKHPDRGGDPEEFKKVQEAHEILTDEQRRRMYDMTGSTNSSNPGAGGGMAAGGIPFEFMQGMGPFGMPGVAFDFGSMFGGMFGGQGGPQGGGGGPGGRRQRPGKSPNKHHDIGLTLADFYNGREIKLKFNQARRCGGCNGSGAETTEPCGACGGRGLRTQARMIGPGMVAQSTGPCDVCSGEGKRVLKQCRSCHGKKFQEQEKVLDIQIRPGMVEGQTLVFSGECSDTMEYEQPGDVVLCLKRADMPISDIDSWEWRGTDLWIRKRISFAESILGFKRTLDSHPSGKKIIVGWRKGALVHGAVMQAPGWGMPNPKEEGRYGTCYVQIVVDAPSPREWTMEERDTLRNLLGGDVETMETEEIVSLEPSSLESKIGIDRS